MPIAALTTSVHRQGDLFHAERLRDCVELWPLGLAGAARRQSHTSVLPRIRSALSDALRFAILIVPRQPALRDHLSEPRIREYSWELDGRRPRASQGHRQSDNLLVLRLGDMYRSEILPLASRFTSMSRVPHGGSLMFDFYPRRSLDSLELEIESLRRSMGTKQAAKSSAACREVCAAELQKLETSAREKRRISALAASWLCVHRAGPAEIAVTDSRRSHSGRLD